MAPNDSKFSVVLEYGVIYGQNTAWKALKRKFRKVKISTFWLKNLTFSQKNFFFQINIGLNFLDEGLWTVRVSWEIIYKRPLNLIYQYTLHLASTRWVHCDIYAQNWLKSSKIVENVVKFQMAVIRQISNQSSWKWHQTIANLV